MGVLGFLGLMSGGLWAAAIGVRPAEKEIAYLNAWTRKMRMLDGPRPPGVVLIGGSNVAFGMDSPRLSRRIGRPVYNAGLHGGLSIDFVMGELDDRLVAGDEVWMMFEYHLYERRRVGSAAMAAVLVDVDRDAWRRFGGIERLRMADDVATYVGRKIRYACEREFSRRSGRLVADDGLTIYDAKFFNASGDLTSHWDRAPGSPPVHRGAPDVRPVDRRLIRRMAKRAQRWSDRGVTTRVLPPVKMRAAFDDRSAMIATLRQQLDAAGIAMSMPPDAFAYSKEYFFDTTDHLNRGGIDRRVADLAGWATRSETD